MRRSDQELEEILAIAVSEVRMKALARRCLRGAGEHVERLLEQPELFETATRMLFPEVTGVRELLEEHTEELRPMFAELARLLRKAGQE